MAVVNLERKSGGHFRAESGGQYQRKMQHGLCPEGWHVASDSEFTALTDSLGGFSVAGGKLKSTRTEPDAHPRWDLPNAGATDESCFSGLPGSYRSWQGYFGVIGEQGFFWSSTQSTSTHAWVWKLEYYNNNAIRFESDKNTGHSVRCIRDN